MRAPLSTWLVFVLLWLLPGVGVVQASGFESTSRIASAAVAALDIGQGGVATVDPGLRLASCPQPLATRVVRSGTVEVACRQPDWKVFVPVRIRNERQVLVLAKPVAAGQTIALSDLAVTQRDLGPVAKGVLVDREQAVGRVARRPLQVGALLSTADLHAEKVIRRGDVVDLVVRRDTVEIRVNARATKDAAVGDSLVVENLSTRKTVQGTVAEDGTVHVK